MTEWIKNAVGRMIPSEINGKKVIPFKGAGKHKPEGRRYGPPLVSCADYPPDGNKQIASLKEALIKAGLK
ncbi:MAG: citrate lyase subunit alpha, partial [Candidatus Marinimicrobia bacterium]|nr:citrate lyase subunit alpha [Candidatus Neomarinimicrobiota bacterium]